MKYIWILFVLEFVLQVSSLKILASAPLKFNVALKESVQAVEQSPIKSESNKQTTLQTIVKNVDLLFSSVPKPILVGAVAATSSIAFFEVTKAILLIGVPAFFVWEVIRLSNKPATFTDTELVIDVETTTTSDFSEKSNRIKNQIIDAQIDDAAILRPTSATFDANKLNDKLSDRNKRIESLKNQMETISEVLDPLNYSLESLNQKLDSQLNSLQEKYQSSNNKRLNYFSNRKKN